MLELTNARLTWGSKYGGRLRLTPFSPNQSAVANRNAATEGALEIDARTST
jgi:hypothetical protein